MRRGRWAVILVLGVLAVSAVRAAPVEFRFRPTDHASEPNPFARALWATVVTPSDHTLVLPAYYDGRDTFAVRARPDEAGRYRITGVVEERNGRREPVNVTYTSESDVPVREMMALSAVGRGHDHPAAFATSDGKRFAPVGANVAWPVGDAVPFYQRAFADFAKADLNWMRIWMAHWSHLNLDWVPGRWARSPTPGTLDLRVAARWDRIVEAAGQNRVYVQMVLQHHGQYSSTTNSNWNDNPWNAANRGGFLHRPDEFFTSARARALTKLKYRYIVARWGWSPAVFAWELFNEVHWTDAMAHDEAAVGAWHSEMADWIRSIDVYHHLITTSTEDLRSPVYEKMDFYQPHLYAADLIVGARRVLVPPPDPTRPVFYGEAGDDHLDVPDAVKKAGTSLVPPAWAAVFGTTRLPAQPWLGATILAEGRTAELGALHRFLARTALLDRPDLTSFSAVVESAAHVPLILPGVQKWRRFTAPVIDVPLDGRVPLEWELSPRIYAGRQRTLDDGFSPRAAFRLNYPGPATARARIADLGPGICGIRFLVDDRVVAEKMWAAGANDRPAPGHPAYVAVPIPAGAHTLVAENSRVGEWVEIGGIDLGVDTSALAAIGQRADRIIALWLWNRSGLYAVDTPAPVSGTVVVDEVPAGSWTVTWWDTVRGVTLGAPQTLAHPGGGLRLPTPPIARHAAVVLTR
jgi:hypothetical protein